MLSNLILKIGNNNIVFKSLREIVVVLYRTLYQKLILDEIEIIN